MLFDTHSHYNDPRFDDDRDSILSSMQENNVGYILNAGCSVKSSGDSIAIAEKYDFIYSSAGVHPIYTEGICAEDYDTVKALSSHNKVKAIGEIGLDYFRKPNDREVQKVAFDTQIDIAREVNLPFIIHCRDACKDVLDILKAKGAGEDALWHCFSESVETARIILNMGLTIAVGGTVTFKNNVRTVEAVRYIPLENLVIETDCPYLAPTPHRGERNSSLNIHLVAQKIAEIKGISFEEVEEITTANAKKFFNI